MPPRPHWKFSASARIAEKQITIPIKIRNEIMCDSFSYIGLAEESLRAKDKNHGDRDKRDPDAVVGRDDQRGELAHHPDDERADEGAERASKAAEDRGAEHADEVVRAHRRLERAV